MLCFRYTLYKVSRYFGTSSFTVSQKEIFWNFRWNDIIVTAPGVSMVFTFVLRSTVWFIEKAFFTKALHAFGYRFCLVFLFFVVVALGNNPNYLCIHTLKTIKWLFTEKPDFFLFLKLVWLIFIILILFQMIRVEEFPVDHHQPCWVTPYLRTQGGGRGALSGWPLRWSGSLSIRWSNRL